MKSYAFITGGLGLIGSMISRKLLENNIVEKVVILDHYGRYVSSLRDDFIDYRKYRIKGIESKLIIEKLLQDIFISDGKWNIAILRYFNPIGAHKSGLIGESPNGTPNNLFPYVSQVAIGKRPKLKIFGGDYDTHDGTGVRDYIHVVDLAKGHIKALKAMETKSQSLIVNLGTGTGYSVLDIVKEFEIVSERTIPYEIVSRREGDIAVSYTDPSLAAKKLNWKAEYELNKMCQDTWRWQSMNPNGYN